MTAERKDIARALNEKLGAENDGDPEEAPDGMNARIRAAAARGVEPPHDMNAAIRRAGGRPAVTGLRRRVRHPAEAVGGRGYRHGHARVVAVTIRLEKVAKRVRIGSFE